MFTRTLLLFLALGVATAALGEVLYKWVDDQGHVHYSDKPQPGAQKMILPQAQTFKAPADTGLRPQAPVQPAASNYTSFTVSSPQNEETLLNVTSVTVAVSVAPALQYGDKITISVDGKAQGPSDKLSATFDGLERGEHSVTATLQQANGKTLTATPIKFYVELPKIHHMIQ